MNCYARLLVLVCLLFAMETVLFAQDTRDFDLLPVAYWETATDSASKVKPARKANVRTVDGRLVVSAEFSLAPDKDNGGDGWSWGEISAAFKNGTANLSEAKELVLTYKASHDFKLVVVMKPPVKDAGGQHFFLIPGTGDQIKTVRVQFQDMIQPEWATKQVLDLRLVRYIGFQTSLPAGGKCRIDVYSILIPGYKNQGK